MRGATSTRHVCARAAGISHTFAWFFSAHQPTYWQRPGTDAIGGSAQVQASAASPILLKGTAFLMSAIVRLTLREAQKVCDVA